jgi:GT2 family glycosyltransferase
LKTAIVILNWNGKKLLEQFLPSVVNYSSKEAEVYVADNASTDNSISFVKEHFPTVKIVQNTKNGGYAKGYNDALQHIEADVFCLVNSDIEVTENWLTPIIDIFSREENTAAIQPKILDYKDKTKFEYAGAGGGFIDAFGYPFCRGRLFDHLETDNGQFDDASKIFWASGACFFIRSSVFKELQGFDEDFFAHQEEIDLCWRANNKGYDIKYVGTSTVYHVGGATLDTLNPRKTYLNFRNSLLSLLKNLPTSKLFSVIFLRLVLDGLAAVKFLIELKPKHLLAILKAHFSFYKNFLKFLKKRGASNKSHNYFFIKSVVWQYYALGRKLFRDLK